MNMGGGGCGYTQGSPVIGGNGGSGIPYNNNIIIIIY